MSDIRIYNRETKKVEDERVLGRKAFDFFYSTTLGFGLLECLNRWKWTSRIYGYSQRLRGAGKIARFVEFYRIDVSELERPVASYQSFGEFFTRKLKASARPIDMAPDVLISPADSRMLAYRIEEELVVPVKGKEFSIMDLIAPPERAAPYLNGWCLFFRLAPGDYHRFCYVDHCVQSPIGSTEGVYRSVSPFSLARMKPVFTENHRQDCTLATESFGEIIHVDVGALFVGRIVQHHREGGSFAKGEEKGYFEFGASTIILLFRPDLVEIDSDILHFSSEGIETLVRYGQRIGKKTAARELGGQQ